MINILNIANELETFLLNEESVYVENDKHYFKIKIRGYFSIDVYVLPKENVLVDYYIEAFNKHISSRREIYEQDNAKYRHLSYLQDFDDITSLRIDFHIEELDDEQNRLDAIFSNGYIDYGARTRLSSLINRVKKANKLTKIPIITFYSYKGGMGRTTTMVSYAIDLAMKGKKVFIIDCDLEAPGYLNFFNLKNHNGLKSGEINGFVEYLCDMEFFKANDRRFPLEKYYINIYDDNDNENDYSKQLRNIYLMPAGNLNEDDELIKATNRRHYLEALARINISNPSSINNHFDQLLKQIEDEINPDIILLDSRTGFNDIIGTSISYLSDMIVAFFGNNAQSIPGLFNLLDEYLDNNRDFKLLFINSILSNLDKNDAKFSDFKTTIESYLSENEDEDGKIYPIYLPLHRYDYLENLGIKNNDDEKYIEIIKNKEYEDLTEIFDSISLYFPSLKTEELYTDEISNNATISDNNPLNNDNLDDKIEKFRERIRHEKTLSLRNILLDNIKQALKNVTAFAEKTDMNPDFFYYRDCMNELFYDDKFLIRGYKGTGKTYLYRALAENNERITKNIIKRAKAHGIEQITDNQLKFIDIISFDNGNKSFPFKELQYNSSPIKDDAEYFFTEFWQIHTWNSILLEEDEIFKDVRENSKLKDYILPIHGKKTIKLYMELIAKGIDVFIEIENDMERLNQRLIENNTTLFILFDQLDSKIKPQNWGVAVSPLINYWRDNYNTYSNILPKIFVRTDLMQQIRGTNTARLKENVINIEWKIEEILGYFIKLAINSKSNSSEIFFEVLKRIKNGKYRDTIIKYRDNEKTKFSEENNQYQVWPLGPAELRPFVYAFFGNIVKSQKVGGLGKPDEYFKRNYANADRNSISLRPFINTFSSMTIEKAKKIQPINGYVTAIIPSEAYASKDVRVFAVDEYFNDLSQNDFSTDLILFKNYLTSAEGTEFRKKTLTLNEFNELLKNVIDKNRDNLESVSDEDDLKSLLEANGIIAEDQRSGIGKIYRFAPLYYYNWQLLSTKFDVALEEDKVYTISYVPKKTIKKRVKEGDMYEGVLTFVGNDVRIIENNEMFPSLLKVKGNLSLDFKDGDDVRCIVSSEPNIKDPNKPYYITKANSVEIL